jgi:PAS domain S-box-containing protein
MGSFWSQKNIEQTFSKIDKGVIVFKKTGELIYLNQEMQRIEALLPVKVEKILTEKDFCKNKPSVLGSYLEQLRLGQGFVFDILNIKNKDNEDTKVNIFGLPTYDKSKKVDLLILIISDLIKEPDFLAIQEKLQLSGQVLSLFAGKESEVNVLRNFLSALKDTVISAFDRKGNYVFMWTEPELERKYGVKIKDLVGKGMLQFFSLPVVVKRLFVLQKMFKTGLSHREDVQIKTPRGLFWQDTSLTPVKNDEGKVVLIFIVLRETTERYDLEKELQEKIAQLKKLNEVMVGREKQYQKLLSENRELKKSR